MKNSALILALTAGIAGSAFGSPDSSVRGLDRSKIHPAERAGHVYVNVAEGTRVQTVFGSDDTVLSPRGTDPLWINNGPLCQDPNAPGFVFFLTSIEDDVNNTPTNPNDDVIYPAIIMNWGDVPLNSEVSGISFTTTMDRPGNFDADGDGTIDSLRDFDTLVVLFDQENGRSDSGRVAVFALEIQDLPATPAGPTPGFIEVFTFTVDFDLDLVTPTSAILGTIDEDSDGLGDFGWGQIYYRSVNNVLAGITSGANRDRFGVTFAEPVGYPTPVAPQAQGVEDLFDIQDFEQDLSDIRGLASGAGTYLFLNENDEAGRDCPVTATTGSPLAAFEFSLFTGGSDPCLAIDFTMDGTIDSGDLAAFIGGFIAGDVAFDLTNDGQVDSGDLAAFISLFLECTAG